MSYNLYAGMVKKMNPRLSELAPGSNDGRQFSYPLLVMMKLTLPFLEVKLIYELLVHHKSPLLGVVKVLLEVVKLRRDSI